MPLTLDKLTPTWIVASAKEITPDALKAHGITAIITDLDNTLVPWRRYEIPPAVIEWLATLQAHGIKLCIASNTIRVRRLKKLSETLGIPFVDRVRKPNVGGFLRAMTLMGSSPENTAVFGDQMFTDILAGNRLGLKTILLSPPLSRQELISTKLVRNVERAVVGKLTRTGDWPAERRIEEPLDTAKQSGADSQDEPSAPRAAKISPAVPLAVAAAAIALLAVLRKRKR
jgi:HAD superfamily phosphatase (TIGR01668 family)